MPAVSAGDPGTTDTTNAPEAGTNTVGLLLWAVSSSDLHADVGLGLAGGPPGRNVASNPWMVGGRDGEADVLGRAFPLLDEATAVFIPMT